jgi:hypothetical protein
LSVVPRVTGTLRTAPLRIAFAVKLLITSSLVI